MFREEFTSSFAVCHAGPLSKSKSEVFFWREENRMCPEKGQCKNLNPHIAPNLGHIVGRRARSPLYMVLIHYSKLTVAANKAEIRHSCGRSSLVKICWYVTYKITFLGKINRRYASCAQSLSKHLSRKSEIY